MRFVSLLVGGSVLAFGYVPAFAGDKVLEGEIPTWVERADLSAIDLQKAPAELIADSQYRMEGGTVTSYTDYALRIDNAESLAAQNTLSLAWMPDKGDLTVHQLEIVRDGKIIDVLGDGAKFDVIRREQGLEDRLLDGELTATLSIPGLRVGDILRTTYSITTRDQALGDEMQVLHFLGRAPWRVALGRAIVSWPEDENVKWRAEEGVDLVASELRDGYRYLEVDLPLARGKDMPTDAPSRFRLADVLRVGTFDSWAELSRIMAPHFISGAKVPDDSEVARQALAIMKQSDDPVERAQLATRLVQDKVSYLLNGLDGGNYLPQQAEFTWDKRYGDCKAKSTLLLALLTRMGIDAEAALVASRGGDALPGLLPVPGDFDHVIVHAVIGGQDYWLDGTSVGTRMYNIADVPNFHHALPLRTGGADLMPMVQREKTFPDMKIAGMVDHSAGVDFPQIFTITIEASGAAGASAEAMADANNPEMLRQVASAFAASGRMRGGVLKSVALTYDKEKAIGRVVISGLGASAFDWKDGKIVLRDDKDGPGISFNPDRSKRDWRDIPVATPGPSYAVNDVRIKLPQGGKGFTVSNSGALEGKFANTRIAMTTTISGDTVHSVENIWQLPGEVGAGDVASSRREAQRLAAAVPDLVAPADVTWRWDLTERQRRERAAPILEAYDEAIAFARADDLMPLRGKAEFLASIYRHADALAAYDQLIEKSPDAADYVARSSVLIALDRRDEAIDALREAYDLDASNDTAFFLAQQLAYAGKAEEGLALLEGLPITDDEQARYSDAWATVNAALGQKEEVLAHLADEVAEAPENPDILNIECWYRGLLGMQLDAALPGCTRAIERADNPAFALDSRAMVQYRRGDYAAAIADLDAVLKLAPGVANSRYLRGIVRLQTGDKGGEQDIAAALTMDPDLREFYDRHGIKPES